MTPRVEMSRTEARACRQMADGVAYETACAQGAKSGCAQADNEGQRMAWREEQSRRDNTAQHLRRHHKGIPWKQQNKI